MAHIYTTVVAIVNVEVFSVIITALVIGCH